MNIQPLTKSGFTESITKKFNISRATGTIFLDVAKALGRVWHNGLINKMKKINIPHDMMKLIQSFLAQRTFHIYINSTLKNAQVGVPQESILRPILYNIYSSDCPKLKKCEVAQFANDTIIFTHKRKRALIPQYLHRDLDTMLE